MRFSSSGNIAENHTGTVALYNSISGNIAEDGDGDVWISNSWTGDITESNRGDVYIKGFGTGNVSEHSIGNIYICAGSKVGNVYEMHSGECLYEYKYPGVSIKGYHNCRAVEKIPQCD